MNLISEDVIEISGMKLSEYLHILVVSEGHQVRKPKVITILGYLVKLRVMLRLHLLLVNILHLADLGLLGVEEHGGIEVGMKLIPKPVVNSQILWLLKRIFLTCPSTTFCLPL